MNLATWSGAQHGLVFIFAVGNDGPDQDTLSPWSVAPWVIGVGAVDKGGKRLWESSSVGIPDDTICRPTVVAHGIEVPVLALDHDPEPEKKHGSNVFWVTTGAEPEPGDELVHETGTSLVTAQVSRICGYIIEYIDYLKLIYGELTHGNAYYGCEPYYEMLRELEAHNVRYDVNASVSTVKKILEAMAVTVKGYDSHQVGSGFVDDRVAIRYLTNFSARDFVRIFCSEETETTFDTWLDEHQGSLVAHESIDYVVKRVKEKRRFVDISII